MSVRILDFYVFPAFGRPLNTQYPNLRNSFGALNALVRNSYIDESSNLTTHALSALAYGELNQRFKFRWFYDKSTDEFQLQQNTATEASPNWVTLIKIRESDGRVTVTSAGGLLATGGFYNLGGLDVTVTQPGGEAFGGVGTLIFDSDSGFYLSGDASGRPVVSINVAAATGVLTDLANVGGGAGVFKNKTASTANLRSLVGGTNVTVQQNVDDIVISSADTGETNTASNLGGGVGVWFDKQGVDLRFRSLVAGTSVELTPSSTEILISATSTFYGIVFRETRVGGRSERDDTLVFNSDSGFYLDQTGGKPLLSFHDHVERLASSDTGDQSLIASDTASGAGHTIALKRLTAGANITLTPDANQITIASTGGGGGGGGFYGVLFKESKAGGRVERDDTLVVDSSSGFYLTQAGDDGKPLLSFHDHVETLRSTSAGDQSLIAGDTATGAGHAVTLKRLTAGSGVTLTPDANQVTIASTSGGFYGIIFKESEAGGFTQRDDTVVFDSRFFYIQDDNKGKPLVSLVDQGRWGNLPEEVKTSNFTVTRNEIGTAIIANNATTQTTYALAPVAGFVPGSTFHVKNINTADLIIDPNAAETINSASTLTVGVGQSARVWSTGTAWRADVTRDNTRRILTANLNLFVRTDGSDSNSGEADTAAGAFLTIQAAINKCFTIDQNGFNIQVNVGPGTYTTGAVVQQRFTGQVTLSGDTTTPSNVIISTTAAQCVTVSNSGSILRVQGFQFQTSGSGQCVFATGYGVCRINGNVTFASCAANHMYAQYMGQIIVASDYSITGGAAGHVQGELGGSIVCPSRTVTLTGTPNFSSAYARCNDHAWIQINACTFSGSATGKRFDVARVSEIFVNGAATTYLPGDVAGTDSAATYGLYA